MQLLRQPVSLFLKFTHDEEVRDLSLVIDPPCIKEANFVNVFEVKIKAAQPCHNCFKSQFQLSDVTKFKRGYTATSNKGVYLGYYGKTKDKPSILYHIEAAVVDFPAKNNIGFDIKEKEKANKVLEVSVRMFHFLHADRR